MDVLGKSGTGILLCVGSSFAAGPGDLWPGLAFLQTVGSTNPDDGLEGRTSVNGWFSLPVSSSSQPTVPGRLTNSLVTWMLARCSRRADRLSAPKRARFERSSAWARRRSVGVGRR